MKRLATAIGLVEAAFLVVYFVVTGLSGAAFGVFLISATAVGWLLASRVPRNPLGWLLMFVSGFFVVVALPAGLLADWLLPRAPEAAAWAYWVAGTGDRGWSWLPPVGVLFTQVLLRFPDGHLPSRRWRAFSVFTVVSLALATAAIALSAVDLPGGLQNPAEVPWVDAQGSWLLPILVGMLLISFVGSVASVAIRFRAADQVTREQIRWMAWTASLVVGFYVASFFIPGSRADQVVGASYGLIPAAIGVAVLRYRLYDIDRIISRTVSYALVTGALVLTYAAVVTLVTRLTPGSSALAVSAATLTAAAVLRPALRRTRDVVDRRFNRHRYDAARTVEEFGSSMRNDVDVDSVLASLVRTVHTTVQPTVVTVWQPHPSPK